MPLFSITMHKLMELGSRARAQVAERDRPDQEQVNWVFIGMEVFKVTATLAFAYYAMSQSLQLMSKALANPNSVDSINEKRNLAKRLRRPEVETMSFDNYELRIMDSVVGVDELDVTFDDIGGLEQELEDVHDNVVLPLRLWRANQLEEIRAKANGTTANQQLCPLPTGIMLFGQPGTGKSLIGKAIAVECKATFINIKASSILDKFVGESDKLASALFRLGRKLGPSIIFIDEIETLLRKRDSDSGSTNGVVQTLQGVFLSEWDGLVVDRDDRGKDKEGKSAAAQPPVVILGATNRPADIDPAFLRRMPVRIQTRMPDAAARAEILSALLKKETHIGSDVDLVYIAQAAEDFSGSDLRELVRVAVLQREKSRLQSLKSSMGGESCFACVLMDECS